MRGGEDLKQVENHPIEDVFGTEIWPGDVYWLFGKEVVSGYNLQKYLIEKLQIECFRAMD